MAVINTRLVTDPINTFTLTPDHAELRSHSREALLRNASDYIHAGWPVFLLGRSKRPIANCPACPKDAPDHPPADCACLTCHGFYAATHDLDRIAAIGWSLG